ncbi:MAG: 2-hydroxyacyl-CoA dehydratase, partial [Chrysiogenales bacterium]
MHILHERIIELKKGGKPVIGCFPLYPPLELFHSMGITPVVLWGGVDFVRTTTGSDRHLQGYTCSVARRLTEFVLSECGALLDGFFMYNACDTLRNLPEILACGMGECGTEGRPILRMHVPVSSHSAGDVTGEFMKSEVGGLIGEVECSFGTSFSGERFKESAALFREMRARALRLETLVARGLLSFGEYRHAAIAACMMTVEEQIDLFGSLIGNRDCAGSDPRRVPMPGVILSGILPPPMAVVEIIEKSGLRVAGDDIALMHRSYASISSLEDDPEEYYADLYRHRFPCTTILPSADRRIGAVIQLARERGASGFIFVGEKFCEYEYFEIPAL